MTNDLRAIREALDLLQYHIDAGNLTAETDVVVRADEAFTKLIGLPEEINNEMV